MGGVIRIEFDSGDDFTTIIVTRRRPDVLASMADLPPGVRDILLNWLGAR